MAQGLEEVWQLLASLPVVLTKSVDGEAPANDAGATAVTPPVTSTHEAAKQAAMDPALSRMFIS